MRILFIFLYIYFNISQLQCETPSCKSNCTTNEACWRDALAYRSSELIEQLFSFSSLSVHVDTYQRHHSNELNDSILLIDQAFEKHLLNESIDSNLPMNLFAETKQLLIGFCKNLTLTPIEGVDQLPSLKCSLATCASNEMNLMVIFITSIFITSLILLICMVESFQIHRQMKPNKIIPHSISFTNPFPISNTSVNLHYDQLFQMHGNGVVFGIFICLISTVFAYRELYESKCKRTCNTEEGTLACWKTTTDGFTYGLSTTMIDFCQVILKIRNLTNEKESWYNSSRDILAKQIQQYELDEDVRQLTKENIEQIAVSLLDHCFNASSAITSFEPSCVLCSETQTKRIKQWSLSSIILISIGLFLVFIIILLYTLNVNHIRRSYIAL